MLPLCKSFLTRATACGHTSLAVLYYVVTEQLQLLAVTDRGKNSKILKSMPA